MGVVRSVPNSIHSKAVLDLDDKIISSELATSSPTTTINRLSFVAGESITTKDLLAIGTDGKVYKASGLASDSKSVFAIAYDSGTTGSMVAIYNQGETIEYGIAFGIGKTIFLSSAGIPTTDYSYTVGNLYQRLGIAITANSFVIKIEESKEMR